MNNESFLAKPDRKALGNLTLKTAIFTLRFASFLHCTPFQVRSNTEFSVKPFKTTWRRWLWYLANVATYGHGIFQVISFTINISKNGLTQDSAPHCFFLSLALFSMLFYANALGKRDELLAHINNITQLMENSKYFLLTLRGESFDALCPLIVVPCSDTWYALPFSLVTVNYFCVLVSLVWPLILLALFVAQPDGHMFLYFLLPTSVQSDFGVFLLLFFVQGGIYFWGCCIVSSAYCWWTANIFQNLLWLNYLNRYFKT